MDVLEGLLEVVLVLPALRRTNPDGDDDVVVDALRNPAPLRLVAYFAAVLEQCIIVSCVLRRSTMSLSSSPAENL